MTDGDAAPQTGIPPKGEVLLGKYRVDRVLGQGGMGVVIAATHLQLDDRFAIKFLLPQTLSNPDLVKRFLREAQASTRIRSEHVVRVFDVGTLPSGAPYMVMEYLDGNDLGYLLDKTGHLEVREAVDYLLQACEAIAEAHALGIVHRDLKPANLFVTRRVDGSRSVKVLDFGISKVTGPNEEMSMTNTSQVMGSPRYMSPEQMRSTRNTDARSDVWALGAIMQELLVGSPVFNAETMTELCAQILQDTPKRLRTVRPDAPPELEEAILRCLEKDPARRFQNVAQLAQALGPFGTPEAQRSVDRIARVLGAAGFMTTSAPHSESAPPSMATPPPGYGPQGAVQPNTPIPVQAPPHGTVYGANPALSATPPPAAPPHGTGTAWGQPSSAVAGVPRPGAGKKIAIAMAIVAAVAAVPIVYFALPRGGGEAPKGAATQPAPPEKADTATVATMTPALTATTTASTTAAPAPSPAPAVVDAPVALAATTNDRKGKALAGAPPAAAKTATTTAAAAPTPPPPPMPVVLPPQPTPAATTTPKATATPTPNADPFGKSRN